MKENTRRHAERFPMQVQAKVTFKHQKESPIIESMSCNISHTGALLTTNHKFPMASKVQIDFYLDLEDLKKLKFVLPVKSLKTLAQNNRLWVSLFAVVVRQDEDGVAAIFGENYTISPVS